MIGSLLAVALLLGAPEPATPPALAQPAWSGEPGWLVLGESVRLAGDGARGAREAARKTGERIAQGIAVAPVRSDLFAGLRKGFIVLVYGAAADRARADTLAAELNAKAVKVYVKQSGGLVRAGARLVRLWGRLDDTIRFPAALTVDDSPASTDKDGWYQVWIAVDGGKKQGSIELCAGAIDYRDRKAARCTDPTGGWFDICHHESYDAKTKDLHVEWSPTPDCYGE